MRCWGSGSLGQLGDGSGLGSNRPVTVAGVTTATAVASGSFATCALLSGGAVTCWGSNSTGLLGNGTTGGSSRTPVAVTGLTDGASITAGTLSMCVIRRGGAVACWGSNSGGLLGDGTTTQRNAPVAATAYAGARSLVLGGSHACMVGSDGVVRCAGANREGQVGDGLYRFVGVSALAPVAGLGAASTIGAGEKHTCAVTAAGTVCWGYGGNGQLGDGGAYGYLDPRPVTGVTGAAQVVARDHRTCARFADGTARCWGSNQSGESGVTPSGDGSFAPRAVQGLTGAAELALGAFHSCARFSDGTARCWGDNRDGQLGDGSTTSRATTVTPVVSLSTASQLSLPQTTTCARLANRTVVCWGSNAGGKHGTGSTDLFSHPAPGRAATGLSDATAVFTSTFNVCALRAGGAVSCWGENQQGQLGTGNTTSSFVPVAVPALTGVTQASGGYHHFCARRDDGTVWCWGLNQTAQCGQGSDTRNVLSPTRVPGVTDVVEVAAGEFHTCARRADRSVWCWGENVAGQLGSGAFNVNTPTPAPVPGITDAVEITAGTRHTCARLSDGTVRCWGELIAGATGDGHLHGVRY